MIWVDRGVAPHKRIEPRVQSIPYRIFYGPGRLDGPCPRVKHVSPIPPALLGLIRVVGWILQFGSAVVGVVVGGAPRGRAVRFTNEGRPPA